MKKNLFLAALAITALVSCSESDYLGDEKPSSVSNDVGAISFGTGFKAVTRAVEGKAAADSLHYNFVVEGTKSVTANSSTTVSEVFDNYNVNWVENTADKTLSNTANWEYVGQSILSGKTAVQEQSIKYWDFAAKQYDFWAYSLGGGSVTVTALGPDNSNLTSGAYTITGTKENLAKVYISDLVTAYNPVNSVSGLGDNVNAPAVMGNEVDLTFRSLVCKVRVGLYETVPGYSVKSVQFYPSSANDATATNNATLYASSESLLSFPTTGDRAATITVKFPTIGSSNIGNSDYNKAHVTFNPESSTKTSTVAFGQLNYGAKHKYEKTDGNVWLGINTLTPTWATEAGVTAGEYSIVMPNEAGTVLTLKVDYTLESTDGTGEPITVHGATALIPSQYTQWKSNYAYTYLFKISDNTNGKTNTAVDMVGLYPITLDAIVVDTQENTQETITTVATPSITTYSTTSNVTVNNEYVAADSIYVTATTDGTLENMTGKATLYQIQKLQSGTTDTYGEYAATEAEVLDALTTYYSNTGGTYFGRDSIKLTPVDCGDEFLSQTEIPLVDGNKITGLTAGQVAKINENILEAGKYYAFVYQITTDANPQPKYEAITPADGTSVTSYYTDATGATQATGTANGTTTYYVKYLTSTATYGIKVIKMTDASNP